MYSELFSEWVRTRARGALMAPCSYLPAKVNYLWT